MRTKWRRFRSLVRSWEGLGRTDPLFGVLSDPTKFGGKWVTDEFFASGRAHVESLLRSLDDLRVSFNRGACLDFGCGVGRLTVPLSRSFDRTVGVDVARSMIDQARRYHSSSARCEFLVNRGLDLRQFPDAAFDFVHSCLVLQHIPPDISVGYIAEFFRVCRTDGLVVFQLPSETRPESVISAEHALPDSAYRAAIAAIAPSSLEASAFAIIDVAVTNNGTVAWRHDIPAGRHICVANHWLREDGSVAIRDDARTLLPRTVAPGERVEVQLRVQAPARPGTYLLEIDLVQELVCWFAEKGSDTARCLVKVNGASAASHHGLAAKPHLVPTPADTPPSSPDAAPAGLSAVRKRSLLSHVLERFRTRTPLFEMHTIPRPQVEEAIRAAGGLLLRAIDDNAAGPRWCSYTYVCRRLPAARVDTKY